MVGRNFHGWLRRLCGGWVAGSSGNKAISAFNYVEVEVDAELGNNSVGMPGAAPYIVSEMFYSPSYPSISKALLSVLRYSGFTLVR